MKDILPALISANYDGGSWLMRCHETRPYEEVIFSFFEGDNKIGIIQSKIPEDNFSNVFCYSSTLDKNVFTSHMGYIFNGQIGVRTYGEEKSNELFDFYHVGQIGGVSYKDKKNWFGYKSVEEITNEIFNIHKERVLSMKPKDLNIGDVSKAYGDLIYYTRKFG